LAIVEQEKEDELLLAGAGENVTAEQRAEELRRQKARVEQRKAEISDDRKRREEEMTQQHGELAAEEQAADAKVVAEVKLRKAVEAGGETASAQRLAEMMANLDAEERREDRARDKQEKQAMKKLAKTAIAANTCTNVCGQGDGIKLQKWYRCITCAASRQDVAMEVCVACKQGCHKGHEVEFGGVSYTYCDCGKGGCALMVWHTRTTTSIFIYTHTCTNTCIHTNTHTQATEQTIVTVAKGSEEREWEGAQREEERTRMEKRKRDAMEIAQASDPVTVITAQCERDGTLWTDPDFPPNASSLFIDPSKPHRQDWVAPEVEWLRLGDSRLTSPNVDVFVPPVHPDDIVQGNIGNCWFMSALAVLTQRQADLKRIFLTQDFNQCGVYHLQFYKNGNQKRVLVDDWVPVKKCPDTGRYKALFASSYQAEEIWPALIEKVSTHTRKTLLCYCKHICTGV
jgi:hypothetical protein